MTDTQHTPGPWAVCSRGRLTPGATVPIHSEPDADGHWLTVANVRTIGPQGDADARLIAAAPELLAALRQAYSVLMDGKPDEADDYKAEAREAARAAIAKATGQTI